MKTYSSFDFNIRGFQRRAVQADERFSAVDPTPQAAVDWRWRIQKRDPPRPVRWHQNFRGDELVGFDLEQVVGA